MKPEIYLNKANKNGVFNFSKYTKDEQEILWIHINNFNPIFKWFQKNTISYGKKIGYSIVVSESDVKRLYKSCALVLNKNDLAEKVLPTDNDIDEWYFESLLHTKNSMKKILMTFDFENNKLVLNNGKGNR